MRAAYVCLDPGVPVFGRKGSSVHCQEVIRVLQQRGYEIDLFARKLGDDMPDDLSQVKIHELDCKLAQDRSMRERALAGENQTVRQLLENTGPFDLVYERYSLWNYAAMQFARDHKIPGILEVNSPLIHEQKTYRTLIDETAAKSIRATCFKNATSIVAVSEQVAERIRRIYFAKQKTTVVPNGVNCDKFKKITNCRGSKNSELNIGFVGTLKPWHGVANLIDSFAVLRSITPNVRLKIVGDGPDREKLEARIQRYPNQVQQSVDWVGPVAHDKVPQILSTFDIAVAPYPDLQDFYFSPLKVLEYMAAGLPIVASRIGQIPFLIEQNISGMLVKSGCTKELTSNLLLLCRDRELRLRLGATARRKAQSEHSWNNVVDRILATVLESSHPLGTQNIRSAEASQAVS